MMGVLGISASFGEYITSKVGSLASVHDRITSPNKKPAILYKNIRRACLAKYWCYCDVYPFIAFNETINAGCSLRLPALLKKLHPKANFRLVKIFDTFFKQLKTAKYLGNSIGS
jgi:hypothetical protein